LRYATDAVLAYAMGGGLGGGFGGVGGGRGGDGEGGGCTTRCGAH
jgi:hypothetical protein